MRVIINNNIYVMPLKECMLLLKIPERRVKCGIYAIKKRDVVEMKNEIFSSDEELMANVAAYTQKGFKVYYNN